MFGENFRQSDVRVVAVGDDDDADMTVVVVIVAVDDDILDKNIFLEFLLFFRDF